ncbi:type-F conjugative transfer system pilin assembly protein TrbC [Aquella oligotrophica]|uniref:Type-F conjugative transfer system pilin assembly protein TrbC n=1 Tax=Aquella oligotrophica TaxID=2067065 RepID=A0A2I7N6H0_9NEIS|nr:type-F conjugative transfer system pilin assembly protein TrbC [Aquella oligotrophica]AUR52048.1 type-F conjugative transfer system pilin assembly protein TrbC [Aquella oligotrophica]
MNTNIKLTAILISLTIMALADGTTVNLSDIKTKNTNQINSVSTNLDLISNLNRQYISQVSTESVQQENIVKIKEAKIGVSSLPAIDMSELKPHKINIEDLIKQNQVNMAKSADKGDIALFLSFKGMERDDILLYCRQATKYNIPIVLRGFINNSFKETMAYIKPLRELFPTVSIIVDPPAYDKYNITAVPALIVSKLPANPVRDGCNSTGDYAKVSGMVSIQAMLDYVRLNSKIPALSQIAQNKLNEVKAQRYFKSE